MTDKESWHIPIGGSICVRCICLHTDFTPHQSMKSQTELQSNTLDRIRERVLPLQCDHPGSQALLSKNASVAQNITLTGQYCGMAIKPLLAMLASHLGAPVQDHALLPAQFPANVTGTAVANSPPSGPLPHMGEIRLEFL